MKLMWLKFLIALLFFLAVAPSASAHRVNVFARVEGDTVYLESKFPGGKKVKAGKVHVRDPLGNELLSGLTDKEGKFSFQVPKRTDLTIVLIVGQGHQAEWTIPASEIDNLPVGKIAPDPAENFPPSEGTATDSKPWAGTVTAPSNTCINPEELEVVIASVLDKKLKPINRMLADLYQKGPGVKDIMAGIGYILGLVGIAAYVHSRKKKA